MINKLLRKKNVRTFVIIFLLCVLTLPVILPYLHKDYFPTHDGEWAVVRLGDMYRELKDLQIPPRYSGNLNFGYGYPLFNFAYPFPYYFGILFHLGGLGLIASIKMIFIVSIFSSVFGMYFLSKTFWKKDSAGIVSALLYLYFPYRFVDLFVRGSIGESVGMALFPWMLLAIIFLLKKPQPKHIAIIAVLFSFLVLAHNIMVTEFSILLGGIGVLLLIQKKYKTFFYYACSLMLGFLCSAFFSVPALVEKQWIYLAKTPIADRSLYFLKPLQLIIPTWGYGTPTETHPFTYQLGWPHLTALITVVFFIVFQINKKKQAVSEYSLSIVVILVTCSMLALLFSPTHFIWEHAPLLHEINYPWTLLATLGFLISLLAGFLVTQSKNVFFGGCALTLFSVISFFPYAHPEKYISRDDGFYLTNQAPTTSSNELMPLWVKQKPLFHFSEKVLLVNGQGVVSDVLFNSKNVAFSINAKRPVMVQVNTIYYPGWKATLDGKETEIMYTNQRGVMDMNIPAGTHSIMMRFTETPLRFTTDVISLIAYGVAALLLVVNSKLKFFV